MPVLGCACGLTEQTECLTKSCFLQENVKKKYLAQNLNTYRWRPRGLGKFYLQAVIEKQLTAIQNFYARCRNCRHSSGLRNDTNCTRTATNSASVGTQFGIFQQQLSRLQVRFMNNGNVTMVSVVVEEGQWIYRDV